MSDKLPSKEGTGFSIKNSLSGDYRGRVWHDGLRAFHQKSTYLNAIDSNLRPYVVQIWSRNTPGSGVNEIFVVLREDGVILWVDFALR